MSIRKLKSAESPSKIVVLSVTKSRYRSGSRFNVFIRCCWKIEAANGEFTFYTEDVMVEYDRDVDTFPVLRSRVMAVYAELKAKETVDADLIYTLMTTSVSP